jgi:hypothetical protein
MLRKLRLLHLERANNNKKKGVKNENLTIDGNAYIYTDAAIGRL